MATKSAKKPASKKKKTSTKPRKRESSYPSFLIDDSPRRTTTKRKTSTVTKKKTTAKPRSAPKKHVAAKPKTTKPKAKPKAVRSSSMPDFISYDPGEAKYVERRERKPKEVKERKERPVKRERPPKGQEYAPNTESPSTGAETVQKRKRRGLFDTDDVREVRNAFKSLSETMRKGIKTIAGGKDTSEGAKSVETPSTASELGKQRTVYDRTPKSRQPVDPWDDDYEATITDLSNDPIYEDCSKYATEEERNLCKHRKRKAVAERYPDVYSGE